MLTTLFKTHGSVSHTGTQHLKDSDTSLALQGVQCIDDRRLRAYLQGDGRSSFRLGPDLPSSAGAAAGNESQTALVLARRRHPHKPFAHHVKLAVR